MLSFSSHETPQSPLVECREDVQADLLQRSRYLATLSAGRRGQSRRDLCRGGDPYLIAGNGANENPKVVSDQATEEDGVRAQILLGEGVFSLCPCEPAEFDLETLLVVKLLPSSSPRGSS